MYLALYRKYRPQTFDDVISQEHITTTLKNQIQTGQIAHAYLFTGTRGTGKTSCAKIMAKAVNCLNNKNGNPCGECAACKAIAEGSTDIIEIDAASNNGVDDIRQIRDQVVYTPIDCKYKVYIIDEVHMLSPAAFNALLKTLEEPPPHVIFILATTEYYKVPATILSRCQQFLFSKIDDKESEKRLLKIAEKEKIKLEPSAAALIARYSDGAMRNALSLLDQCISVSNRVDEELVRQCSGTADTGYLFAVSGAAISKNPAEAIKLLDGLIEQGKDISRFIEELTLHYRNLMLEKTVGEELIKASQSELEQYRQQCRHYSLDEIMYHIDLISNILDSINRMKQTGQARLLAEQLLIKLSTPKLSQNPSALMARIGALESKLELLEKQGITVSALSENSDIASADNEKQTEKISREKYDGESLNNNKSTDLTAPKADNNNTEQNYEGFDDIPLPPPPSEEYFDNPDENYQPYVKTDKNYNSDKADNTNKDLSQKDALNSRIEKSVERDSKKEDLREASQTENTLEAQNTKNTEENRQAENKDNIPKTKSEKKAAGKPIFEKETNLPQNVQPLPQWQEIISKLPPRSRGLLNSSNAYLYNGIIYISATPSSEKVLKDGEKALALRQAAKGCLGGDFEMYILKENPDIETEETDNLTSFLQKAESLGINVKRNKK